ncbi:MAG: DUF1801 domain-containing protein [Polyangiaceae bacterium]
MPLDTALFRLPAAVEHAPEIDGWLSSRREDLRPLVERWFERLRGRGADVRELMHDGAPTVCVGDAAFAYVNAFSKHVNVGFFMGAFLEDPLGLLQGTGKRMRHVKLRPDADVDEAALERLIDRAYRDMQRRVAAGS